MSSRKIICSITGKSYTYSQDYYDKKVKDYVDESNLAWTIDDGSDFFGGGTIQTGNGSAAAPAYQLGSGDHLNRCELDIKIWGIREVLGASWKVMSLKINQRP